MLLDGGIARDPNQYITRNLRGKIRQENCKNGGAIYLSWGACVRRAGQCAGGAQKGRRGSGWPPLLGGNFERLLVRASVVGGGGPAPGMMELLANALQANKSNCSVGARVSRAADKWPHVCQLVRPRAQLNRS
ncbi:hypothetical protein EVAR_37443_1 [Eumeta japonica]|uniref:Uncharacterized protein n=1 Tax=Eumeta variegata TaxID=151549 RepID=A0A4C1X691_EUMVA|nr:hypothetical protein EVAR_37443_1 [Eumeta japonica]